MGGARERGLISLGFFPFSAPARSYRQTTLHVTLRVGHPNSQEQPIVHRTSALVTSLSHRSQKAPKDRKQKRSRSVYNEIEDSEEMGVGKKMVDENLEIRINPARSPRIDNSDFPTLCIPRFALAIQL